MSGPKSYSYRVDPAVLEARRRQREARARLAVALSDFRAFQQECSLAVEGGLVFGVQSELDFDPDSLDPEEATSRITTLVSEGRVQLARKVTGGSLNIERRSVSQDRAGKESSVGSQQQDSEGTKDTPRSPAAEDDREDLEHTLERILSRLRPDIAPDKGLVAAVNAAKVETEPGKRQMAVDLVRRRVGEANDAARRGDERRKAVAKLLADLAECNSPEARRIERLLDRAIRDPAIDLSGLEIEIEELREEEDLGRAYVEEALEEALVDLGYIVGPEFSTLLVEVGFTDIRRGAGQARWPEGYAVRVRRTTEGQLSFNVVRAPSERNDQVALDLEVEQSWCASVEELEARLAELGVEMIRRTSTEAGTQPVQVVEDRAGFGPSPRARTPKARLKERNGG